MVFLVGTVVTKALILSLTVTNLIAAIALIAAAGIVGDTAGKNISDLLDTIFGLYNDAGAYT